MYSVKMTHNYFHTITEMRQMLLELVHMSLPVRQRILNIGVALLSSFQTWALSTISIGEK